jgi:hypothetical protein
VRFPHVYNERGEILPVGQTDQGYPRTYVYVPELDTHFPVKIHRIVAFQKFGERAFEKGTEVRHLDSDKSNFADDNITIGTRVQNIADRPPGSQLAASHKGARKNRKYSDELMERVQQAHKAGMGYTELRRTFNIRSAGAVYQMIKGDYKTEAHL